jgi:hypothetical protein
MERRGRPPIKAGEATIPVNTRIPVSVYDRICKMARTLSDEHGRDVSVAEIIRNPSISMVDIHRALESVRGEVCALRNDMDSLRGMNPVEADEQTSKYIAALLTKAMDDGWLGDAA